MALFFFFCFGLIIGSFLNVVILRFENDESLGGRSYCPQCKSLIHWYDNIPVFSYLLLRGRCRMCRNKISLQYPLVELLTAFVFLFLGQYSLQSSWVTIEYGLLSAGSLILASILILIFVSDVRTMEIPVLFLVLALGATLFLVLFQAWSMHPYSFSEVALPRLVGGLLAGTLFYALVFFSRERWMGMGDVWVAAVLGLLVGIQYLLPTLTLSFFFGAVIGVALLWLGKKTGKSQIPFAPFLIAGLAVVLLLKWLYPEWLSPFVVPIEVWEKI